MRQQPHRRRMGPGACLLALVFVAGAPARGDESYWALFADRSERTAARIDDWSDNKKPPRLAGRMLFDRNNPVRILRNTEVKPSLSGPRVVFTNGDVLPGRVSGFAPADEYPGRPTCLAVVTDQDIRRGRTRSATILVRPRCVRRIVLSGQPRGPYRPGTLMFANGHVLSSQAIRWGAPDGAQADAPGNVPVGGTLRVLTDRGIRTFALSELAEIHMPARDVIGELLADALGPLPHHDDTRRDCGGIREDFLVRVTTAQGAALTCPAPMMFRQRYWFMVQPVWALHAIQIWLHDLCLLSVRRFDEVPLSLLPAEAIEQKSFTGFVWPWQRNRSVRGHLLASGSVSSDLGVGTHSYSAIAFDLPREAVDFTFSAALDNAVGTGGCVKLRVDRDSPRGRRLWASGFLRGADKCLHVGPVRCKGARRLVLVTEFAHDGRPAGADPADVRDEVNWLAPLVRIDPAALDAYAGSPLAYFPGVAEMAIKELKHATARTDAKWEGSRRRWEPLLEVPSTGLTLTRKVRIVAQRQLLQIEARSLDSKQHLFVRAGGTPVDAIGGGESMDVGNWDAVKWWDLSPYVGREVALAVHVRPENPKAPHNALRNLTVRLRGDPVLVPTSETRAQRWRYTTKEPARGWRKEGFDDSKWRDAPGVFGHMTDGKLAGLRTKWQTREIWLRRSFQLDSVRFHRLHLKVLHDDDAEIYLNGKLAARLDKWTEKYRTVAVSDEARRALRPGRNILAVHCRNESSNQYIDVGLAEDIGR